MKRLLCLFPRLRGCYSNSWTISGHAVIRSLLPLLALLLDLEPLRPLRGARLPLQEPRSCRSALLVWKLASAQTVVLHRNLLSFTEFFKGASCILLFLWFLGPKLICDLTRRAGRALAGRVRYLWWPPASSLAPSRKDRAVPLSFQPHFPC